MDANREGGAEDETALSGSLLREIFHSVDDGLFVYDVDAGEILDANETLCEMVGHSRKQIRQLTVSELHVGDRTVSEAETLEVLERAAAGEQQRFDWEIVDSDDTTFQATVHLRGLSNVDDNVVLGTVSKSGAPRKTASEETQTTRKANLDRMTDAFFALDADRRFTYLNDEGREIICRAIGTELSIEELRGRHIWDEIPEAVGTVFYEKYEQAFQTGETVTFEAQYDPLDTLFEIRAYPSESGLSVYVRDITEQRRVTEELDATVGVLHNLYRVASDTDRPFEQRRDRLIEIGCGRLDLPYGFLTRISEEKQTIVAAKGDHDLLQPGEQCRLKESYCKRTIESDGLLAVFDALADGWETDPAYDVFELGSYIGGKVVVDGELYGTLCFASDEPRNREFTSGERTFVELASRWLSYELEQRRYRERIERSSQRYQKLAENFPNGGVYLFDETLTYTLARGEGLKGDGLTPKDVEGHTVDEVFPPAVATLLSKKYRAALDGERVVFEHTYGGEQFLVRVVPFHEGDDTAGVGMAVTQNITERKKREQELERHKAFLEESMDIITVLGDDGTVKYESPAIERVLGYKQGELTGTNAFEIVHPDDRAGLLADFEDLAGNPGATQHSEAQFQTASGEWRWLEVRGINRLDDPVIDGVVVNSRNITQRKTSEKELERQNERLEQFASVVSHDLRNPLNVAMTRLELLRSETDSEHLADIQQAHERMESLIRDLLTLAREGGIALDSTSLSLEDVAETSWETVQTTDATLVVGGDQEVQADRSRLQQMFENLFRNSVEHGSQTRQDSNGHSDVTVTVGPLEDGFYVEDDGPGIPGDEREKVFDTGYSTVTDGTGFGLDIVSQIVEAHGWRIEVTAGQDGGARFEITDVEPDEWAA